MRLGWRLMWMLLVVQVVQLVQLGSAQAAPTAQDVLADEAFGFCHDTRYPLTDEEAQWCSVLPEPNATCPTFRAACEAPRAVLEGGMGPMSRRSAGKGDADPEPKTTSEERPDSRGPDRFERKTRSNDGVEIPSRGLGPLPQILMWLIVGAMVVMLVMQLRGPGVVTRARRDDDDAPDRPARPHASPVAPEQTEELDVSGLLARAQRHAEQGQLDAAVADGHEALFRRLAERDLITLHSSRTNGDHVRTLRGDSRLHGPTRAVVRVVERVQFGHAPLSREEVDAVLGHVRTMLRTLASVLLVLFMSLACTPTGPADYPWSHSPSGTAGVLELLRGHGLTVEYRRTPLDSLSSSGPTPIVLDQVDLSAEEWSTLLSSVHRGGNAVIATSEPLPPELGLRHTSRTEGPLQAGPAAFADGDHRVVVPGDAGLSPLPDPLDDASDPMVIRIGDDGTAYAIVVSHGQGLVVVLADDRLLTNAAVAVHDNGSYLAAVLTMLGDEFELVDGGLRSMSSNEGASDPFDAMARAHLTPVILQGLLLIALLYLWRGVHFGRPRAPKARSRRRFTEHVEALAQQYQRAGARRHALRLYSGWALERIQERFGGTRRGLHALAGRIAARTGRDETEIMRILAEAQHARDEDHEAIGDAEDLRILRELGRLLDTTTAGRR